MPGPPRFAPSAILGFSAAVLLTLPLFGLGSVPGAAATADAQRGYQVLAENCFKCHGGGTQLGGLDLRTQALALKGGKHGAALVPGKSAASRLLKMVHGALKPQMPPTGALSDTDVRAVQAWIDAGARYPASASAQGDGRWWAFRPVRPSAPPKLDDAWVKSPIDAFLLAKMKAEGVRPNPPADRATLIRRATFDLWGLPPTPEEVEAFVGDRSPNAYEKLIDRLLASPRYGERWGRHWLDLARYAESEGFKADETRPNAWRYRDYVIQSFNADKPYDRFVREQIAGDELDPENPDALVATGFNRHWADESNARNLRLRRQEILNDITDTVGSVFLGVTLGCARCHDHKYDAITQKDYYRIQAFFAAVQPRTDIPLLTRQQQEEHRRRQAEWEERTREPRARLAALEAPYREKLVKGKRMPFPAEVQDAIDTPATQRTALQWQLFHQVLPQLALTDDEVGKAMKAEDRSRWQSLRTEMARWDPMKPAEAPTALGVTDVGKEAPKVFTLGVGVYDAPVEEVQPGFLSGITTEAPRIVPPTTVVSTGRRTALANWLASPDNPLTARVMVNRVWQSHFGRGLVPSANDFGKAGEPATHPELLDWLAARFAGGVSSLEFRVSGSEPGNRRASAPSGTNGVVAQLETRNLKLETPASPWSLKALHRLIMLSSAYRQSSAFNAAMAARDPEDRLLWRYRRSRLEAEAIRDTCLAVSGELNEKMGGPSIFPELPDGVSTRGGWPVNADPKERARRSVYIFVRRNLRYPLFQAFDFPDTHEPCARRNVTNTAPQALMLFNSELALKWSQSMAGRLVREAPNTEARVERAYRLAFGRAPESSERDAAVEFMKKQTETIRRRLERKEPVALPAGVEGGDAAEGAALVDFCHALMNANEFLYVD